MPRRPKRRKATRRASSQAGQFATLASRYKLPASYVRLEFAQAGGLMTGRSVGFAPVANPADIVAGWRNTPASWPVAHEAVLRLNVGRSDHLAPLVGFVGDERRERGGRA